MPDIVETKGMHIRIRSMSVSGQEDLHLVGIEPTTFSV